MSGENFIICVKYILRGFKVVFSLLFGEHPVDGGPSVTDLCHPSCFILFAFSSQSMSAQTCATTGFVCSSRTRHSSEGRKEPTKVEPKCCWILYRVWGSWSGGIHSIPPHPTPRSPAQQKLRSQSAAPVRNVFCKLWILFSDKMSFSVESRHLMYAPTLTNHSITLSRTSTPLLLCVNQNLPLWTRRCIPQRGLDLTGYSHLQHTYSFGISR